MHVTLRVATPDSVWVTGFWSGVGDILSLPHEDRLSQERNRPWRGDQCGESCCRPGFSVTSTVFFWSSTGRPWPNLLQPFAFTWMRSCLADRRHVGPGFGVGAHFEGGAHGAAEAGPGMFFIGVPADDDFGAVDGAASLTVEGEREERRVVAPGEVRFGAKGLRRPAVENSTGRPSNGHRSAPSERVT